MKVRLAGDWVKKSGGDVLIHNDLMDKMIGADMGAYAFRLLMEAILCTWRGAAGGILYLNLKSQPEKKTVEKLVSLGFLEKVE